MDSGLTVNFVDCRYLYSLYGGFIKGVVWTSCFLAGWGRGFKNGCKAFFDGIFELIKNPSFFRLRVYTTRLMEVKKSRGKKYKAEILGIFLWKVAYHYVKYGYCMYALREIPEGKDLNGIDEKIRSAYAVTYCRMTRLRRKKEGMANVVYIRYRRSFILLGTPGAHESFSRIVTHDINTAPLHFKGYSIGIKGGKPSVMITAHRMKKIAAIAYGIALHNEKRVTDFFQSISPYTFPGVVRQIRALLFRVNRRRKRAGLSVIPDFHPSEMYRSMQSHRRKEVFRR